MCIRIPHDCHLGERPGPDEEVYERGVEEPPGVSLDARAAEVRVGLNEEGVVEADSKVVHGVALLELKRNAILRNCFLGFFFKVH